MLVGITGSFSVVVVTGVVVVIVVVVVGGGGVVVEALHINSEGSIFANVRRLRWSGFPQY